MTVWEVEGGQATVAEFACKDVCATALAFSATGQLPPLRPGNNSEGQSCCGSYGSASSRPTQLHSAPGKYLACICGSGATPLLRVWDWRAGKEAARQQLQGQAKCLAWSDNTTLVTAGSAFFKANSRPESSTQ